jgi:hypothetical protein
MKIEVERRRSVVMYRKRGMLADIREGLGHGGNIDRFGAVPIEKAMFRRQS